MSASENSHLRGNSFKLGRELHDKSLRLDLHLDQEEWSVLHHAEEALAIVAVCLMGGHHDCPTIITVNADKLENYLMSLTLSIQSLQKHVVLGKARKLGGRKRLPLHVQVFAKMNLLSPPLTTL